VHLVSDPDGVGLGLGDADGVSEALGVAEWLVPALALLVRCTTV